ncbi:MAG: glycosyltransferase [Lachnospiraceae bacterium]|nr:glycosyltransferase [Lachnospiraceae bacterium]
MARLPVSVCMIAKNEEHHIEQCLRKLLRYDMEIVVADTGSTDKTKEIAAKYTNKVFDFAWCDDFSAARNFAVSKASNNWILILDCDEYVQDIDVAKLRTCMQKYPKNVGVMEIKNVYTTEENGIAKESIQIDEVPRFFNRNYYEYRFRIHEQISPKRLDNYDEMTLETFHMPVVVKHYGYDIPMQEMRKKQERNLKRLLNSLGETEGMDDYIYFQIGQSYSVLEDYEKAIEAYDMCLEINRNPEKKFLSICLESYADCLMNIGNSSDAYRLLDMNRAYLKTTKLRYLFGKAAYMCKDDETAIGFLTGVTDAADFEQLGENVFDVYARIFAIYKERGQMEKIERYKSKLAEFARLHGKQVTFAGKEAQTQDDRSDKDQWNKTIAQHKSD